MSIQGLRRRFAAHFKYVLYVLVAVFTIGLALLFTPGSGIMPSSSRQQAQDAVKGDDDVIAKAGSVTLRRSDYNAAFGQGLIQMQQLYAQMGMQLPITLGRLANDRLQAVQGAIQEQLLLADARARGISASRGEVKQQIESGIDQQLASLKQQSKGQDFERLLGMLYSQAERGKSPRTSMSERQFRGWLSDRAWSERPQIEKDIITQKLRVQVAPRRAISDEELAEDYDKITTRDIQVSFRRKGQPDRTDAEAKQRAEELLAKAKQGGDFAALAKAESDSPNAKETGGLRPEMSMPNAEPEWRRAVGPAKVGDIVGPVRMSFGYVIVKVEKRTRELPKDFEKNKKQLMDSAAQRKQSEAWNAYLASLQQKAKVTYSDPEMLAYDALSKGKSDDALKYLQQAAEISEHLGPIGAASVYYQLATIYASRKEWAKAEQSYEMADNQLSHDQASQLVPRKDALYGMATAYQQMNKPDDAATWYMAARDQIADKPDDEPEVNALHQQISAQYQKMGEAGVAKQKAEDEWMADYRKAMEDKKKAQAEQRAAQLKAAQEAQKKAAPPSTPAPAPTGAKPVAGSAKPASPVPAPK